VFKRRELWANLLTLLLWLMTLIGVGSGTIVGISGGDHNIVGGCTLRNSVGTAVSVRGGHHNTVIGNDIYDVGVHIATNGKKMHLFCAMLCQTLSFYQDRLRTNIGKALKIATAGNGGDENLQKFGARARLFRGVFSLSIPSLS
jgi:hypothetical protein